LTRTIPLIYALAIMNETAKYIKDSRKELGLTQKQLAEIIDSKRSNIAKYETGRSMPPGDLVLRIQELLKKQSISKKGKRSR